MFGPQPARSRLSQRLASRNAVDAHRTGDVLEACSPRSSKAQIEPVPDLVVDDPDTQMPPGSAIPSSRAATFTPSPWMSPSSTMMSPRLTPTRKTIRWSSGVAALRSAMPAARDGAGDRLDDARELDQDAVAGGLDDAALVLGDVRIDQVAAMRLEPRQGAGFVLAHQPAVAGDIGGENGREPAFDPLSAQRYSPRRATHPSMGRRAIA